MSQSEQPSKESSISPSLLTDYQVSFSKFPTLQELADSEALGTPSAPPPKRSGLFEELLQGRLEPLLQDAKNQPSKYTEEDQKLLGDLYNSGRQPTESEQKLLNEMVVKFSARPPPPEKKKMPAPNRKEVSMSPPAEEPMNIPASHPGAFWWL